MSRAEDHDKRYELLDGKITELHEWLSKQGIPDSADKAYVLCNAVIDLALKFGVPLETVKNIFEMTLNLRLAELDVMGYIKNKETNV